MPGWSQNVESREAWLDSVMIRARHFAPQASVLSRNGSSRACAESLSSVGGRSPWGGGQAGQKRERSLYHGEGDQSRSAGTLLGICPENRRVYRRGRTS